MQKLSVKLPSKEYEIYIENGLFDDIGSYIKQMYNNKKIAIITDTNVKNLYADRLVNNLKSYGYDIKLIEIEPGESSKSLKSAQYIYEELILFDLNRSDLIIALGGGVIGDLTGFVASTFLRGTPFIQIPTTLLSQIDSSVGGKVAVNLEFGKNLIGSFYHPEAVFIDPKTLETLDTRVFNDGIAEMIKYGCIEDDKLFYKLKYYTKNELKENIEKLIYDCCSIKARIVQKDEKDKNLRMILNFGHTIGHAIEKYFNYEKYTHGEAVAMGMSQICKKSEELGLTREGTYKNVLELLKKFNLPHSIEGMDKKQIIDNIYRDKKRDSDNLNIILISDIGYSFIKKINKNKFEEFI